MLTYYPEYAGNEEEEVGEVEHEGLHRPVQGAQLLYKPRVEARICIRDTLLVSDITNDSDVIIDFLLMFCLCKQIM